MNFDTVIFPKIPSLYELAILSVVATKIETFSIFGHFDSNNPWLKRKFSSVENSIMQGSPLHLTISVTALW